MSSTPRNSWRAALRRGVAVVHLWFGLILGLYFVAVGLSGSLLVFEPELKAAAYPETVHVAPPTPGVALMPVSDVLSRLKRERSTLTSAQLSRITLPERQGGAYSLTYGDFAKPMEQRIITVNPYTGVVMRDAAARDSLPGFSLMLHGYLLLGAKGFLANGYAGGLTVLLILSGLWLWWPKTLRQLRIRSTVKWRGGAARVTADLHNVLGIYFLPLLLILSITGVVLVFYMPVQTAIYKWTKTPPFPSDPTVTPPRVGTARLSVEQMTAIAERALPDAHPTALTYPQKPDQPFGCAMEFTLTGFSNYAEVFVDPYTGRVLQVNDERHATAGARIMRVLCNLHFGWWGGPITKSLYTIAGILPTAFSITGLLIYLRKRQARRARQ